ncbi:MAG: AAA family ATPase [Candidatus Woesearchaeota archaeon]
MAGNNPGKYTDKEISSLNKISEEYSLELEKVLSEMQTVIVGQGTAMRKLLIALISGGHVLMEGVPGLAKTLMIKTMSDCLGAGFVRLQFTPDLLPADIIGTKIYNQKTLFFTTKKGPIFSNFILADEINRAPPKVQSALLEAMQEKQVTIQGETFILEKPFLVLATQNPIESEGTYKLPEAQVDRFMFKILITYPSKEEEKIIIERFTQGIDMSPRKLLDKKKILELQDFCPKVYADNSIEEYVSDIVDATRHPENHDLDMGGYIEFGASPRASIWLILAAKANAILEGRGYVIPEDIKSVAHDVLRHRVILTYEAEAEDISPDDVIDNILDNIRVP